jgi:FlaA1/EpsC-like NDP-sugar epimerase
VSLLYLPLTAIVQLLFDSIHETVKRSFALVLSGLSSFLIFGWITTLYLAIFPVTIATLLGIVGSEGISFGKGFFIRDEGGTPDKHRSVLIVGAGEAGEMVASEIIGRREINRRIVGFLDDDNEKQNRTILDDIPVLGSTDELVDLVDDHDIDEIIIAMPSVSGDVIRTIVNKATETSAALRIVPGIRKIIDGDVHWNQIRSIRPEDLLGRETVTIDRDFVAEQLRSKSVLVTGAAGSIGSNLVQELCQYPIRRLLGIDTNESDLYELEVSELNRSQQAEFDSKLVDVRDEKQVQSVIKDFNPDYVLHAAALKNVPMVERNSLEALKTNILGTVNLAEAVLSVGGADFIFISTDKAVQPENVMGHTKRIGERYMSRLQERADSTRFVSVRFGNVLGSRGSVVPLFKRQIEEGGPVTVTDPDMVRYFMTPGEAVKLVLTASAFDDDEGWTYVLEMGDPISIMDLARQMIALSGYEPETEIPIEIVGMREGESLREELYADTENPEETSHSKISKVNAPNLSQRDLDELKDVIPDQVNATNIFDELDRRLL